MVVVSRQLNDVREELTRGLLVIEGKFTTAEAKRGPDLKAMAGWSGVLATVLLSICGFWINGYVRDMRRIEDILNKFVDLSLPWLREQTKLGGQWEERISSNTRNITALNEQSVERFKELDSKLQNEMRLADATATEKMKGLDEKLQMEMDALTEMMNSRRTLITEVLTERMEKLFSRAETPIARVEERVRLLEAKP